MIVKEVTEIVSMKEKKVNTKIVSMLEETLEKILIRTIVFNKEI
jgi:hypothetical protein